MVSTMCYKTTDQWLYQKHANSCLNLDEADESEKTDTLKSDTSFYLI
jgi:hypothetical protein